MSSYYKQPNTVTLPSIKLNKPDDLKEGNCASSTNRFDSCSVTHPQRNARSIQLPNISEFDSTVPSHAPIFRTTKKLRTSIQEDTPKKCHSCHSSETPEWRKGPFGPRTLCNACGLIWSKLYKQEQDKNLEKQKPYHQNNKASSSASSDKLTLSFLLS
ncbi:hypothetical protein BY458DRAFT_552661 [Sporodiniella umbellata]|nr:hypothetical protein BY458DRAFT_552661 [Sporodiniella umbellata]